MHCVCYKAKESWHLGDLIKGLEILLQTSNQWFRSFLLFNKNRWEFGNVTQTSTHMPYIIQIFNYQRFHHNRREQLWCLGNWKARIWWVWHRSTRSGRIRFYSENCFLNLKNLFWLQTQPQLIYIVNCSFK